MLKNIQLLYKTLRKLILLYTMLKKVSTYVQNAEDGHYFYAKCWRSEFLCKMLKVRISVQNTEGDEYFCIKHWWSLIQYVIPLHIYINKVHIRVDFSAICKCLCTDHFFLSLQICSGRAGDFNFTYFLFIYMEPMQFTYI